MSIFKGTTEPKKIYIRVEAQPITTSGIYHNSDLGLISLSSDGSNWITIADKNLGATQVYNSGDTLSEANCGKYYQWGNNYGFPFTGSVATSSTQVDASTYGPGNYYNSSTFIMAQKWSSVRNDNLWGGTTGTVEAMRGPCDTGFHVPTKDERGILYNIGVSLGLWSSSSGDGVKTYIKLPYVGTRSHTNSNVSSQGTNGNYWSCTADTEAYCYRSYFGATASSYDNLSSRGDALPIRPFKNEATQPDDSRTKLY